MSDVRTILERGYADATPPPHGFERMLRRRDRKRRNHRIAAGVVGIAVFVAAVWIVTSGGWLNRTQTPAVQPTPTPPAHLHQPGDIALLNGELIDSTTGRATGSLPIPGATDMSWSPDGSSLVYAAPDGVFVLVVDTHDTRQLVPCGAGPRGSDPHACTVAWSPTSDEIAVAHDEVLEVVSVDGGREIPLRSFPAGDLVRDPSWSPDGEQLAFTVTGPPWPTRALYTVARDGSNLTRIVEGTPDTIGPWAPSWSPDGSRIAYIDSDAWDSVRGYKLNVTAVDPDGTNPTVLMDAGVCGCINFWPGLDWSPDGTRLALLLLGDGLGNPSRLYTVDADGAGLTLLQRGPRPRLVNGSPAWRPAG
jgi:Tol biopolymer transport system component